jgi:hypothetical protein
MSSAISSVSSTLTSPLLQILQAEAIEPGSEPSYHLCKTIYTHHPLGAKVAESPVAMAMSQEREITVQSGPEGRLVEAFLQEWEALGVDGVIFAHHALARVYGVASLVVIVEGQDPASPMDDLAGLWDEDISFTVFDPLNTSGSLVLNQNPNDPDFLKTKGVTVQGQVYHPSRVVVAMNERPVYLAFTSSAFGYVGRSVYQRALFPLKSFIQTMITDDMVIRKAGLIIAMMKQAGSVVNNAMQKLFGVKRQLLKEAESGQVLSIGIDEKIETLNMQNLDGPYTIARKNILENIAAAADGMPAKILNNETFAEGFGEGSEDAKHVARYIDRMRKQMQPDYAFMDRITMHRAWNPEFYRSIQNDFPEYAGVSYEEAFNSWRNSFKVEWPNLLTEPDSEKSKAEDVKLQAVIKLVEAMKPDLDPKNLAVLLQWAADNFNEMKLLFGSQLVLDFDELQGFLEERLEKADEMAEAGLAAGDEGQAPGGPEGPAKKDSQRGARRLERVI